MRYFIDFEFIEDGLTINPLSLGICAEDGREYYAEFQETDRIGAHPWVVEHVFPHLDKVPLKIGWVIADEVKAFCDPEQHGKPEFWGYYADYDWVALCQLFGTMMDLPKGWPKYCHDLKQWCDDLGNPKLPKQNNTEHHALADAIWNREVWDFLHRWKAKAIVANASRETS